MNKPEYETLRPALNWNKACKYIEVTYDCDLRNFAGKTFGVGDTKPYQDFWYFMCDHNEVHNGSYIYVPHPDDFPDAKPWQKQICKWFHDEFADGNGDVYCHVSW